MDEQRERSPEENLKKHDHFVTTSDLAHHVVKKQRAFSECPLKTETC